MFLLYSECMAIFSWLYFVIYEMETCMYMRLFE